MATEHLNIPTPQGSAQDGEQNDPGASSIICVDLTPREREVLDALAHGLGSKYAARQLQISYETIRTHQRNIYRKLGARSLCNALNVYRK